jgi:hypothetical protein
MYLNKASEYDFATFNTLFSRKYKARLLLISISGKESAEIALVRCFLSYLLIATLLMNS